MERSWNPTKLRQLRKVERAILVSAGGLLGWYGLRKKSIGLTLAGGTMAWCGYGSRLGAVPLGSAISVEKKMFVNRPPAQVYQVWRQLNNLPRFMRHLDAVRILDYKHSQWFVTGPTGRQISWTAEMFEDVPNQRISWRSLPGSDVVNAGTVCFEGGPHGHGTELSVTLRYAPPGGVVGRWAQSCCATIRRVRLNRTCGPSRQCLRLTLMHWSSDGCTPHSLRC